MVFASASWVGPTIEYELGVDFLWNDNGKRGREMGKE